MRKRFFRLVSLEARKGAAKCIAESPDGYFVTVAEPTRSGDHNAALHAHLNEIADRCEWAGRRWDIETWKRLLTAAWCRATGEPVVMLPALDGAGVDIVFRRTSSLSNSECSELIAFIEAWAAHQPAMQKTEDA
ncbi:recombination protein NinB [Methylibium sp.]|uniref:recombination protein NinB n=1 Tax=Methylibium sp. TaxID=2067992 RepID=UPI00183922E9|nr:recombination protein NinB [Methylibium sp.]MBA3592084.1 recombination protein NinB [Methylibium sp.]